MPDHRRLTRVLFVNHGAIIGGAETNLLSILKHAPTGDFEPVGVLLPNDGPLRTEVRKLGIDVGRISYHAFNWRNPFRYAQTMAQLVSWIRHTRPAAIHLNHQWLVSHVVQAGIITRTPVVCHTRNYLDAGFVGSQRRWLDRSQAIVAESQITQQRALALGLPQERVRLIYNGIDLDRFGTLSSTNKDRRQYPVVGFSGRIVPEKGPEDLIRAMPFILERVPTARLCFLGQDQESGAYVEQLKSIVTQLGIEQSVAFLGFRPDIENVLKDFDVLAVPSRPTMPEGLPLSAIEGLAAGCIVVATPNSGIPEAIRDGETGFLAEPENPLALAQAIIRALTMPPQERTHIRHNGRKLMQERFSIERQVAGLGKLYQELTL